LDFGFWISCYLPDFYKIISRVFNGFISYIQASKIEKVNVIMAFLFVYSY